MLQITYLTQNDADTVEIRFIIEDYFKYHTIHEPTFEYKPNGFILTIEDINGWEYSKQTIDTINRLIVRNRKIHVVVGINLTQNS